MPALINGDFTGLSDEDEKVLNIWLDTLEAGYVECSDQESDYKKCEITGFGCEVKTITLNIWE